MSAVTGERDRSTSGSRRGIRAAARVQRGRRARRGRRACRRRLGRLIGEADDRWCSPPRSPSARPRLGHVCVDLAADPRDGDRRRRGVDRPRDAAVAGARPAGSRAWPRAAMVADRTAPAARRQLAVPRPLLARGAAGRGGPRGARRRRGRRRCGWTCSPRDRPAVRRARSPTSGSSRRPPRRCCAASRSSPAGRAPARRRPSPASSRCSRSRRSPRAPRRRSSRSPPRRARPPPGSPRRSTTRRRGSTSTTRSATRLLELDASTLHRLLGWKPGTHSRFRHDRGNRLPYDVVIVDETSMVSLSLMARLIEAVRPRGAADPRRRPGPAHLDRGRRGARRHRRPGRRRPADERGGEGRRRARRPARPSRSARPSRRPGRGGRRRHRRARHRPPLRRRRSAARGGDPRGRRRRRRRRARRAESIAWIDVDAGDPAALDRLAAVREARCRDRRRRHRGRARRRRRRRDPRARRVPPALRPPPRRRTASPRWMPRIETWLAGELARLRRRRSGTRAARCSSRRTTTACASTTATPASSSPPHHRPPRRRVRAPGRRSCSRPRRLAAVETVYAMTVHKSQGSQFDTAAVLLPDPGLTDPHPRAALHGRHPRAEAAHARRHGGVDPRRRRTADRQGVRAATAAVGLTCGSG